MKITKTTTLLLLLCLALNTNLFAQETETKTVKPLKFLIGGALEFGGDEIAEVYFTNGETQSVKAGQGGAIGIGGQLQIPRVEKLLLRATVGYKYVTTQADNVHIRLTRIPIHVTANYMVAKKLRLSSGLAMHQNIKFKADGIGQDLMFDAASGPIFEVAYSGIGLSYTAMKYKDQEKNTYSANAIGVTFTLTIPGK